MKRRFKVGAPIAAVGALGLSLAVAWPRAYQVDFDARDLGMTSVIWTTDSYDYTRATVAQIVANAGTVQPGGIILFHDGYTRTLDALPKIVANLASRGLCAGQIVPSANPIVTGWDQTFSATVVHW